MSGNLYRPATMLAVSLSTEGHSALSSASKYPYSEGRIQYCQVNICANQGFLAKNGYFWLFSH